jgi:hypothetical protein
MDATEGAEDEPGLVSGHCVDACPGKEIQAENVAGRGVRGGTYAGLRCATAPPASRNLCIAANFCTPFAPAFGRSIGNVGVLSE